MPNLTEKQRLEAILGYCDDNKSELGRRLGMSPQSAYSIIKRGSYDVIRLANAFPEISYDWLINGTGPMMQADAVGDVEKALATLGITMEQVDMIKEGARPYTHTPAEILTLSESDPVDRALLNLLLREKSALEAKLASKDQELEVIRQRNLKLEKENAVLSDRMQNAEAWYRAHFPKQ